MINRNYGLFGILGILVSLLVVSCGKDDPEKIAEKDREKILEYIAEHGIDAIEHESGVFYYIESQGSDAYPQRTSVVRMKYTGTLLDGDVFDGPNTTSLDLRSTILGWQYGIPLFSKGSSGILLIPSGLGYGQYPQLGIPANSVLKFDIEIIDF